MSQLFNKYSHLNRYKVNHGLRESTPAGCTSGYIAQVKLIRSVTQNLTEEMYVFFKSQKKYNPKWMATFEMFRDRIIQHIENDRHVTDKLELLQNTDLETVIDKYINKRKKS